MSRSESPFQICGTLRRDLELYAERELRDRISVERVRRHLDACEACADYLSFYDDLTASLLAEAAPSQEPALRVERILEPVGALFPAQRVEAASVAAPLVKSNASRRRVFPALFLRMAAAFVLAGLIGAWLTSGRGGGTEVASKGSASAVLAPSGIPTASAQEATPRRVEGELRWVLDDEQRMTRARYASLLRLYGFRPGPAQLAVEGEAEVEPAPGLPEWVVDVLPGGSRRQPDGDKVFLIAEDPSRDARGPVEIFPVTWFAAHERTIHRLAKPAGVVTVYRVYVMYGPAALERSMLPETPRDLPPVPDLVDPRRGAVQWTLPMSWER